MKRLFLIVCAVLCLSLPVFAQSVVSLTLINADTDQDIGPLGDGGTVNYAVLGTTHINVRANTSPAVVGSVRFGYDANSNYRTENGSPYAINGDNNGNYASWTPSLGVHTITATAYSESNAGGTAGAPYVVSFNVINQSVPENQPPVVNAGPNQAVTLPENSATLNGSASDPDGSIASTLWTQTSGPSTATLTDPSELALTVSDLALGTYTFQLTATDNEGLPSSDTVNVLVQNEPPPPPGVPVISGALIKWQPVTVDFAGPEASELDNSPNPFLDYRLQVSFTHPGTGKTHSVPGYFDGDGQGDGTGSVWRVKFNPDEEGLWNFQASFSSGFDVAVSGAAGTPGSFDGVTGSFIIAPRDPSAPGFLKWGLLEYANGHYFKFRDGSYFVKGGTDSPETFLSYAGFDSTPFAVNAYAAHVADWQAGDPDWNNGAGKGIIGALNYLASRGVNSIYFLLMNIGGDGQNVWPFAGFVDRAGSVSNDNTHYDISKLAQWGLVFEHAQRKGILLHVVLNEAEEANKRELDNATLGTERKLFYRELISRFGYLNALQWNISEEYNFRLKLTPATVREWAGYIQANDPYKHPITVHNYGTPSDNTWPFLGDSLFSITSFQDTKLSDAGSKVELWRAKSVEAGRPIVISFDEFGGPKDTLALQIEARRKFLWPAYMSGGGGLEWYLKGSDSDVPDFRLYDTLWLWTGIARTFVEGLPVNEMVPQDALLTGESTSNGQGQVLAKANETYAIYFPSASATGTLSLLGASGVFEVRWFNPRTGAYEGDASQVTAPDSIAVGPPPGTPSEDWVAVFRKL